MADALRMRPLVAFVVLMVLLLDGEERLAGWNEVDCWLNGP